MQKVKDILLLVVLFALVMTGLHFAFKVADGAWENRAKAAGYYDTLPDSMKNPKDIKK